MDNIVIVCSTQARRAHMFSFVLGKQLLVE